MFRNLFGPRDDNRQQSTSRYQPLQQDDGGDISGSTGSVETDHSQTKDMDSHRDAAAQLLIKLGRSPKEHITISPADDARVLRRIDMALLPLMLSVYFLQALDKATLSYASIFGLIEDIGLEGDQFSWLGSIVSLAQLVMQPPLALALVKLPIGKFTSVMVLLWGATLAGMTWANSFHSLMVARFFLGAFEASIGPSFVAITQMWWRRREQTMRIGSWYCMNGMTWVFGSLITYGLAKIDSHMKSYQIIFLFFGLVTVAVSFAMFFWMPNSPTEAKFLSNDDKIIAIERLRNNQMGVMSREWRPSHLFETFRDLKSWLWVALIFSISVPSNGISTFGPLIIQSFVSDPFQTMLFNVPIGISHILAVSGSAYLAMKWKLKGPVIALLCIPPIVGCSILLHFTHNRENKGVLLAGYFCLSTFTGITPLIYSWSAQNTAGDTKRKCTTALIFVSGCAGNMLGPLLYSPDEAPAYSRGLRINLALYVVIICLVGITSFHLRWLNRQHGRRRETLGKSAVLFDGSLATAEEVARIESMERAMRRSSTVDERSRLASDAAVEDQRVDNKQDDKAFEDITDLENEDFLFVF